MDQLEDLIKENQINFLSHGKQLGIDLSEFGQYNWDLINKVTGASKDYMVISGDGLQDYLSHTTNLQELSNFIVQMYSKTGNPDFNFYLDIDIEKMVTNYALKKKLPESELQIGYAQDTFFWAPQLSSFERCFYIAFDIAMGGFVGYPGYEHPQSKEHFQYTVKNLSENFHIGNPEREFL